MDTDIPPENPPAASTKGELECQKLELEISTLRKPFWKHFMFWPPALSVLAILGGALISWNSGWFDQKQLEIKNANLVLQAQNEHLLAEKENLTSETAKMDVQREKLNDDVQRLNDSKVEKQQNLFALTNQLTQLQHEQDEKQETIKILNSQLSALSKEHDDTKKLVAQLNQIESERDKATAEATELRGRLALSYHRAREMYKEAWNTIQTLVGERIPEPALGNFYEHRGNFLLLAGKWRSSYEDDVEKFKLVEPAESTDDESKALTKPQ